MKHSQSTALWTALAAVTLGAIVAAVIWLARPRPADSRTPAALGDEEKAYLAKVTVSDLHMSAARNFLGNTVTYLDGKVTNEGARAIRQVDLRLEFTDTLSQVVLRDAAHPVTPANPPLKLGETRPFRLTFDHMPVEWNQAPPSVTVTAIRF